MATIRRNTYDLPLSDCPAVVRKRIQAIKTVLTQEEDSNFLFLLAELCLFSSELLVDSVANLFGLRLLVETGVALLRGLCIVCLEPLAERIRLCSRTSACWLGH